MQALSGTPSGYWHCTIGNPKKPFFSCGDLITTSVTLSFGKVLAYNDLPSTIKIYIMKKLLEIQAELKCPKGSLNKFGNYKYRSAEQIQVLCVLPKVVCKFLPHTS